MKRTLFPLLLGAFVVSSMHSAAADPWVQIISAGCGDTNNEGVGWVQSFNGSIYVAFDRAGGSTGGAVMIRSSDFTNWSRVVGPGSATVLADPVTQIIRMTATTNDIYFGTAAPGVPTPAQVYHSTDGTNWTHITTGANGYVPSGNSSIGGLAVLGTNLFTATVNNNGAQIWRSGLGGNGFVKMADFSNGLHVGSANTNINFISYLYAGASNMLYASTGHLSNAVPAPPKEGFLYQSNDGGVSWTTNSGVGLCFGDTNNWHISCMAEFRGYLYAAVNNSTKGGQLWRTDDRTNWVKVLSNGINDARTIELHHLTVDQGFLWVSTMPAPGFADESWRSSDGTNFTQSCLPGFGEPSNASRFPSIGGLGSNEFYGIRNLTNGAQVWRLGPILETPVLQVGLATNRPLLSWPELALGFDLEETTSLVSSGSWTWSTNVVVLTNAQKTVSVTPAADAEFYRLRRP